MITLILKLLTLYPLLASLAFFLAKEAIRYYNLIQASQKGVKTLYFPFIGGIISLIFKKNKNNKND
jgi:hypothetical protein